MSYDLYKTDYHLVHRSLSLFSQSLEKETFFFQHYSWSFLTNKIDSMFSSALLQKRTKSLLELKLSNIEPSSVGRMIYNY